MAERKTDKLRKRVAEAVIPDDPAILLNEFQLAKLDNVSVFQLRQDRYRGIGVPFRKIGGLVRYSREDIDRRRDDSLRFSTSEGH